MNVTTRTAVHLRHVQRITPSRTQPACRRLSVYALITTGLPTNHSTGRRRGIVMTSSGLLRKHQASLSKLGAMEVKQKQKRMSAGNDSDTGMPAMFAMLPRIVKAKSDQSTSSWNNFGAGHAHGGVHGNPSTRRTAPKKKNAKKGGNNSNVKKAATFGGFGTTGGVGSGVDSGSMHGVKHTRSSPWRDNTSPVKSPFAAKDGAGKGRGRSVPNAMQRTLARTRGPSHRLESGVWLAA